MEYRDNARIDQSRVRYGGGGRARGGGGGRGRGVAVGGGVGGVVVLLLVLLLGGNLGDLGGLVDGGTQDQGQAPQEQPQCTGEVGDVDLEANPECRWALYDTALYNYWSETVRDFEPALQQLYSGQISTACGTGSSQMGPFYCPADHTIYLDSEFMGKLLNQLGAEGGEAAELYIVGHEYGHHISNLTGQLQQGRQGEQSGPTSGQVRLELQADCYAGVFFNNTLQDPSSPIEAVTSDDLRRIVEAARAVGDDHIQQQQGGDVVPESWTHGSSEMRQRWVTMGFESGDPNVCDTFGTDDL